MNTVGVRVFIGLVLMVAACVTAFRIGGPSQKKAAILVFVCWGTAALMQIHEHYAVAPLIGGDLVYSAGLLWLAWRYHERWLWIMVAVQVVFFLHVARFERGGPPTVLYIFANNVICAVGLVVLTAVSIASARKRRAVVV
ncbi:MAG: hypothetical protein ACYDD1_09040 [Caulobacteraceae bacterium]